MFVPILLAYAILIRHYRKSFSALRRFDPIQTSSLTVSVIVPARNEENKIQNCIQSLRGQQGILTAPEIIVVNDGSTDGTCDIVKKFPVSLIHSNPGSNRIAFKKMALATGVAQSKSDMILTTDADCIAAPEWIRTMSAKMETDHAVMVAGPVRMLPKNTLLSKFQALDYAILQGITAASVSTGMHDMSSGANLGYLKNAFDSVNGFEGIDDIASGDDMLLMQKFNKKFPGKISYVFSEKAIIDTDPEPDLRAFLKQRIRWASKAGKYEDRKIRGIMLLVYFLNLLLLLYLLMIPMSRLHLLAALIMFTLKTLVERRFVWRVLNFFSLHKLMPLFPLFQPVHVIYTVISATFSQTGTLTWKGRRVK